MSNTNYIYFCLLLVIIIPLSPTQATEDHQCDVLAFIIDQDPKGLNVRSAPNKDIISKIPTTYRQTEKMTQVHIIATQKNWLKIDQWFDGATVATFSRDAWIYNRLVAISIPLQADSENTKIYAQPHRSLESTGQLEAKNQLKILNCQDQWIFVEGKAIDGQKIKGWLPPQ